VTQPPPFDVDTFLAQPLTARVATSGPTVRPTWYLWEDGTFWILTGPWATLPARVQADPAIAIVVDVCDLATGLVQQVIARGRAEILPFDVARGRRKLSRYLGQDETRWDDRFPALPARRSRPHRHRVAADASRFPGCTRPELLGLTRRALAKRLNVADMLNQGGAGERPRARRRPRATTGAITYGADACPLTRADIRARPTAQHLIGPELRG
jgi:Pyridoxamine 5'-phosphate oxidase